MILNPTCENLKTQETLVESGVGMDGCVSGEGENESTQVLSRGGSKSIFYSLGSFNNYVDQILPNFDPLPLEGTNMDILRTKAQLLQLNHTQIIRRIKCTNEIVGN